jgi:hypothetical protein
MKIHYDIIAYAMGRPVAVQHADTLAEAHAKAERMPATARTQGRSTRVVGIRMVRDA